MTYPRVGHIRLGCPRQEGAFFFQEGTLKRKWARTTSNVTKISRLLSLPLSLQKVPFCKSVQVTRSRFLLRQRKRKTAQDAGNGGSHYPSKTQCSWLCPTYSMLVGSRGELLRTVSYVPDFGKSRAEGRNCLFVRQQPE